MICESCMDAALDEGVLEEDVEQVMRSIGDELGDHECDQVESGGEIPCACACQSGQII
jgi:hypothetical protein